jgi:glycerate dehydrogenase
MRKTGILINVARGGIVDERALAKALRERWINGAATDVFSKEPARKGDSPLLDNDNPIPNLIVSPHVAWYASSSIQNLKDTVKTNVEGFLSGKLQNLVDI